MLANNMVVSSDGRVSTNSAKSKANSNTEYRRANYTSNERNYGATWNRYEPEKDRLRRKNGIVGTVHDLYAPFNYWMNNKDATPEDAYNYLWKLRKDRLVNEYNLWSGKAQQKFNSEVDKVKAWLGSLGITPEAIAEKINGGIDTVTNFIDGNSSPTSTLSSYASSTSGSGLANAQVGQSNDDLLNQLKAWRDEERSWSAAQAQKQMDFQERMARNSHTYEVEDLKRAGLNPVLSAGASAGAPAGNGAQATEESSIGTVAQIAMMALETAQVVSASGAAQKTKNGLVGLLQDKNFMNVVSNVGKIASTVGSVARLFG